MIDRDGGVWYWAIADEIPVGHPKNTYGYDRPDKLFWSNKHGWINNILDATLFDDVKKLSLHLLPIGLSPRWVQVDLWYDESGVLRRGCGIRWFPLSMKWWLEQQVDDER